MKMREIRKKTKFNFDELYICCTVLGKGNEFSSSDSTNVLIQDGDKFIDVRNYDNDGNPLADCIFTFSLSQILSTRENEKSSLDR